LGGNGYVEESILARLYRQAPLNSIWEGSGNIQCLDVLRALAREPACGQALMAEIAAAAGMDGRLDEEIGTLEKFNADPRSLPEAGARYLTERIALALQASVLLRAGRPAAAAFCHSRLGGGHGRAFGTLGPDAG